MGEGESGRVWRLMYHTGRILFTFQNLLPSLTPSLPKKSSNRQQGVDQKQAIAKLFVQMAREIRLRLQECGSLISWGSLISFSLSRSLSLLPSLSRSLSRSLFLFLFLFLSLSLSLSSLSLSLSLSLARSLSSLLSLSNMHAPTHLFLFPLPSSTLSPLHLPPTLEHTVFPFLPLSNSPSLLPPTLEHTSSRALCRIIMVPTGSFADLVWAPRVWYTLALQHTAIHYNILQRTATHCNTLQDAALVSLVILRCNVP